MECGTIAGSPNWYLSQILDCSWDNRVAYGSLSSLVILHPSQIAKPITLTHAHTSRVLSVSFAPKICGNSLLSTSETGEVYVWNLDTHKVALLYKNPHKCMTFGSWSHADGTLIVCADESGTLLLWRTDSNTVRSKAFKEHSFVAVACCPHDQGLVATGTKHGLVCVINIKVPGKEFILHKLRGHDAEVVSLSWCPVRENIINPKNKEDCFLLASSAKEKKIFFWRAGQDGLYEAYVDMPLTPRIQGTKLWSCVSWCEPQQLLASNISGEVYSLGLSKLKTKKTSDKGTKWERFSDNHIRCHVVVKCSPWISKGSQSEGDWRNKESNLPSWIWTCGGDRLLVGISSDRPPIRLNTIGGPVHAMVISPIDGTSLALGVADKSIRVVNLSEPNFKTMQTFQQKVSGKVMALAWHPSKDGWLAYGTSDGRIGIHFTCSVKLPILFRPFTKESIYAMEWGPTLLSIKSHKDTAADTEENEITPSRYVLYAIGGGRIAAIDPNYPDKFFEEPFKDVLKLHLKFENSKSKNQSLGLSDLAWKPDFTLLALGDEKGSIYLLNLTAKEELQLVSTFKAHTSLIQDLMWHPLSCTLDKTDVSVYANWLASVSNDVTVRIFDASVVLEALQGSSDSNTLPVLNIPSVATLNGHKSRVSKVAWSPHEGGRLLSVSYDQCAQVWDVINRQPLSCYTQHSAPLYSCLWSPFNPDVAITAGQDGTVCLWSVQDQENKVPITKGKDEQVFFDGAKEARSSSSGNDIAGIEGDHSSQKTKNKKREKALLPLSGPEVLKEDGNLTILRCLLNPPDDGNGLIDFKLEEDKANALPLHYAFFGDHSIIALYLMKESKSVSKENSFTLDVWRGSPKDTVTEAIKSKSLSDYIVSIAPTVSHKLWVEACAAYAEQLKEANEFSKASAYLLAIHKVEDAIMLLMEQGKYRHALAVARCRLPADDPIIKQILISWAEFNIFEGRLCLAAVCLASAGEWEKAAQLLSRKKSPERLFLASQIMKEKSSDHQTGNFYARECFDISLVQKDWETINNVLKLYTNLNHLALWAYVHKIICTSKDKSTPAKWLNSSNKDDVSSEPAITEEEFVNEQVHMSKENVEALQGALTDEITVNSEETAWLLASRKVTLAFLSTPALFPIIMKKFTIEKQESQEHNLEAAYRNLVQAMSLLYHFHITNMYSENTIPIILKFCMWLAPHGVLMVESVFSTPVIPLQSSLRAYLAAALLLWLVKAEAIDLSVGASAIQVLNSLKSDIFSTETLKWFKVDFKLKVLLDTKVKQALGKKKVESHSKDERLLGSEGTESVNDIPSDKLKSLTIGDDPPQPSVKMEVSVDNVIQMGEQTRSEGCTKAPEELEIEELTIWLKDFVKRREKVPNPYLSYSNLIQYLKSIETDDDCFKNVLEEYSKFWEETNQLLDV